MMFLQIKHWKYTLRVTQIWKYGMYRKAQSTKTEFLEDILQNSHRVVK